MNGSLKKLGQTKILHITHENETRNVHQKAHLRKPAAARLKKGKETQFSVTTKRFTLKTCCVKPRVGKQAEFPGKESDLLLLCLAAKLNPTLHTRGGDRSCLVAWSSSLGFRRAKNVASKKGQRRVKKTGHCLGGVLESFASGGFFGAFSRIH